MEKSFNLDYRWKDLYITLLPGFYFFVLLLIFCLLYGIIEEEPLKVFCENYKDATSLLVLILPFLWILLGVLINGIASTIERFLFSIGLLLRPLAKEKQKKQEEQGNQKKNKNRKELNKEAHDRHRDYIISLSLDSRIEEYYVHYAMGRNMLYGHCIVLILSLIILLFIETCSCGCSCGCLTETNHTNVMVICGFYIYMVIMMIFLFVTYRRYHTRYEELIRDLVNNKTK